MSFLLTNKSNSNQIVTRNTKNILHSNLAKIVALDARLRCKVKMKQGVIIKLRKMEDVLAVRQKIWIVITQQASVPYKSWNQDYKLWHPAMELCWTKQYQGNSDFQKKWSILLIPWNIGKNVLHCDPKVDTIINESKQFAQHLIPY